MARDVIPMKAKKPAKPPAKKPMKKGGPRKC